METLNKIWEEIYPYLPMLTQVVIMPVLIPIIKKLVGNKVDSAMSEKRIKAIQEQAYNSTIGKVKEISFKHNIQPAVNSALENIQEKAMSQLDAKLTQRLEVDKQNALLMKHFIDMFENSVMCTPEKKAELQKDFDKLMEAINPVDIKTVESTVTVEEEPVPDTKKTIDMEI